MNLQAEHELSAMRQALDDARKQLSATRALVAERQTLLESERAARALAERRNALKDEFLAIVSHELRSPLTAIAGWAHILRHGASQEDSDKALEVIEQSVEAQTKLIEDLLDISRVTSGQLRLELQPVEPRSFIDAAVATIRPAADAKGLRIRKVLDLAAGPVAGDPRRLQQVLVNLLSNAVKFTPEQGWVEVALRRLDGQAEIKVVDTGIGIPPAFLPHVFDRFRQADDSIHRRYGGLGLGLAIVKHLVELQGGSISAESPGEGGGATFVLRLPRAAGGAELAPVGPSTAPATVPSGAAKSLLASSAALPGA
jgi:signal transduction histidine kinase